MDMSLDDIIKSRNLTLASGKRFNAINSQKRSNKSPLKRTTNRITAKDGHHVVDARLKIIQKNRAKIRDARDKLAEITRSNGDVRRKLIAKQKESKVRRSSKNMVFSKPRFNDRLASDENVNSKMRSKRHVLNSKDSSYDNYNSGVLLPRASRRNEVLNIPGNYIDYDNMNEMEEEWETRLCRTVKNDTPYDMAPPAPRRIETWGSLAMDQYDPLNVYEAQHESRHERRLSVDMHLHRGLGNMRNNHERSPEMYQRRYIPEPSSHLSYEMRTRLENAPDPHVSMGIFSNSSKHSNSNLHNASSGYRIVVSNLHVSVTQSDIKELFEDIGELYDSRIVRPGIAEVVYKSFADAEKAVDTYHNRQLDGQPMKCLLVNPRASNKPTAPAVRSSSNSITTKKTPLEIDIDALHKVLFRRN